MFFVVVVFLLYKDSTCIIKKRNRYIEGLEL